MPSRPAVICIIIFWFSTLGLVLYRDVWPRLAASGPPPIAVDLSDEASQFVPVRWRVLRGDQQVGKLTTQMAYIDADDTFEFWSRYYQVEFDFGWARVAIPELITTTRLSRTGQLREQGLDGKLVLKIEDRGQFLTVAEAEAKVRGRVVAGLFTGRCEIDAPPPFTVKRDLDPIPVKEGQALNPLQPVNRIAHLRPGRRWMVHEVNPLGEALAALFQEQVGKRGLRVPEEPRDAFLAEVGSSPELLRWGLPGRENESVCWVIDYRRGEATARTWVQVSDGKVLRQEAMLMGDRLALEREY